MQTDKITYSKNIKNTPTKTIKALHSLYLVTDMPYLQQQDTKTLQSEDRVETKTFQTCKFVILLGLMEKQDMDPDADMDMDMDTDMNTDNESRACIHFVGQTVPSCEMDMWRRNGYENVDP